MGPDGVLFGATRLANSSFGIGFVGPNTSTTRNSTAILASRNSGNFGRISFLSRSCRFSKNGGAFFCGRSTKNFEVRQVSGRPVSFLPQAKENMDYVKDNWRQMLKLNHWVVRDYYKLVEAVNSLESSIRALTDEQLRGKTDEFRQRLQNGATLDSIQAEAFAVVREAARRTLGMRHFDVQIIGGAVLHDGGIAEMKTGEGKTLVSPLAAYLNSLTGRGVHVVTVNDYLAQRDAEWMGQIHRFLGLSVGLVQSNMRPHERKEAYACDITYSNNAELGFDYLRDHTSEKKEDLVMRWPNPFNFAIVDEVDSVLIDEGRNPLLISSQSSKDAARYPVAAEVADFLVADYHYKVDWKDKNTELTEEGVAAAELALDTEDLWDERDPWARFVITALKAKEFHQRDVHYIVKDEQVQIVDEFTGRVVENRRWSDGIHQAVEAKEGLRIQADTVTVAQITYQSFFKLYPKLSGMTGTAKTEEAEFLKIYKMPVVEVPTNLPNIRQDLPLQLFPVAKGKWEKVREEVEFMYTQGRPVLVGTTSVEQSEYLSELLRDWGIPHNVLNARPKYAAREAEIVAQAGRKCAITIATNMAGRGTDIILGGNSEMLAKEIVENNLIGYMTNEAPNIDTDGAPLSQMALSKIKQSSTSVARINVATRAVSFLCGRNNETWNYREAKSKLESALDLASEQDEFELEQLAKGGGSEISSTRACIALAYISIIRDCQVHCQEEGAEVKRLGGLHVIGTALHESRRVDNQLRGRAGRQGDPGSTRFMISLQDEMFRKFNAEWASNLISKLGLDDNIPIENRSFANRLLDLQKAAERYYFGVRKSLVEYDEVMEVQRKHVYNLRQALLLERGESCKERLYRYMQAVADDIVLPSVDSSKSPSSWKLEDVLEKFHDLLDKTFLELPNYSAPSIVLDKVTEEMLINALEDVRHKRKVDLDDSVLPGLPPLPDHPVGLRRKASAMKRWLEITSDGSVPDGEYQREVHLLRKYLGDILVTTYQEKLRRSSLSATKVEQLERVLAVKALDQYWRDHLINMNRLRAAVNVRSFGHMNPLEEYKIDGCRFFIAMLGAARRLTVESLLQPWVPMDDGLDIDLDYI
ncbi:preprotein translocase subunit SecA [Marchantia polymorpha subsp. ruderalis]|uniref:Protein translocase subunit SecA n=2 Tax=Marchantia polymorpha TaxID=3197 RepID=A0AAF6BJV2_MARPO|nr:hypothetical protein MARPO_0073s0063 [Marchantia polymorpha]BBN12286.1 hypothetical protein Mp_5g18780 [Marchantia polymorpha subsp. ruderalis]|eukprot:PTQ35189.1 hypothetical protein MARPO_0073s0063 [Marchantia polymorpha]